MQGVLSAVVLSLIPIIRPFQWQSLLLPVIFHIPAALSLKVDRYLCGCSIVSIKTNSCDPLFLIFVKFSCTQVLPMRMLDFLDAPVPFLVSFSVLFLGVKKKRIVPFLVFVKQVKAFTLYYA